MPDSALLNLPFFATLCSLLGLSFFLNYLSALYSEANLFKIDLVKKRKDKRKIKKLVFVLKNGNLLFAVVCIYQVFINIFLSEIFVNGMGRPFLEKLEWERHR